jgi:hypothetical protein
VSDLITLLNDPILRAELARGIVPALVALVALSALYLLADFARYITRK